MLDGQGCGCVHASSDHGHGDDVICLLMFAGRSRI